MHGLWDETVRAARDASTAATGSRSSTPSASSASSSPSCSTRCRTRCARPGSRSRSSTRPARQRGPYPIFDNVTAIFSSTPGDHAHRDLPVRLHRVDRRRVPGQGAAARDLLAADEPDLDVPGEPHRRRRGGPLAGEYFAWNFNSGMAAIDAVLAHLVGYRDIVLVQPQRVRRRAPAPARLVRQAQQPRHRGRVVRRLRGGATSTPRSRQLQRGARASGSRRADASTCTSSRRATRTATCSTCPGSAAPRTRRASR